MGSLGAGSFLVLVRSPPTGRAGDPHRGPVALVRWEKILDDDRVCAAAKARTHLAATRPKPAASTDGTKESPIFFLFHLGFWCVCVCREALSNQVELV